MGLVWLFAEDSYQDYQKGTTLEGLGRVWAGNLGVRCLSSRALGVECRDVLGSIAEGGTYIHTYIHTYIYIYIERMIERGLKVVDMPKWGGGSFDGNPTHQQGLGFRVVGLGF